MHLGHEFVEVGAALVGDRALLKEQIHQHGLAASDFAMNIEPARWRLVFVLEQPAQQALLAHWLVARKARLEAGERLGGARLRRIGLDRAGGDEGLIMGVERGGRRKQHGPLYGPSGREIASREMV